MSDHVDIEWQFSVRLTPKARTSKQGPETYKCTATYSSESGNRIYTYYFNNPYVAMDVLSTWVLFRQKKPAERCRSKLHKPYQLLWDSWREIEKACETRLRTLQVERDEELIEAGSANTGFTGVTGTQQFVATRHFAERKEERGLSEIDICRCLKR